MRLLGVTAAAFVALAGYTAAASVPTLPSPSARKAPPKTHVRKAPAAKKDPRVLREAVDSGDDSRLAEVFYKKGYSVHDFVDDEANRPLHRAAELCNLPLQTRLQLIKGLINVGGDLRSQNKWGDTPFAIAKAKCGGPPAVLALLTPTSPAERADQKARGEEWWQRGNQAMNSGSPQQALPAFLEAEKADPTNPVYYNAVAMAYERMGNWEGAVRELQVAVGLGHQIGISQSSLDDAMQKLREQQTPQGKARALLQQAEQLRASGAYQQAIQVYDQARSLDPTNAAIFNGEGVAYYQLGDYATAERAFQLALQLAPDDQVMRTNLQNARQQIAAAEQRRQQAALQQQYQQQQRQYAYEQAQRAKRNEFFNTVTQGLALGQQLGEASRPPPRPAPPPAYSSAPRPYAPQSPPVPQYRPPQPAPAAPANQHTPNPANNGTGCVHVVANPGNWGSGHWYFKNDCGWPVEVTWDRYTSEAGIAVGGHYPTGMNPLPSPFIYLACKSRREIGAELYWDHGTPICTGPAA